MPIINHIRSLSCRYLKKGKAESLNQIEYSTDWLSSLMDVSSKLEGLAVTTEQEFLDIGAKLQDFYSRAQEMSKLSSQVVELMTGDDILQSTKGLSAILEELKLHLGDSDEHFIKISNILRKYLDTLTKVCSSLDEFSMLVLNLRMLGFFTRVENAQVFSNDTGFASLTDDVKKLAERIKEKSLHIRSKTLSLLELTNNAIYEVAVSKKSQRDQAKSMLDNTVSNHNILAQKNDAATRSAQRITNRANGITESIGNIVSSLQFHDITRQQIEHVKEVLDNLISSINTKEHSISELASGIADVCTLQLAQLSQSRDELTSATTEIRENLKTLASSVGEILEETEKVAWASKIEGLSFMEEIDSGINTVITCLDENSKEQIRLTGTMTTVSDMVSEMSFFIQEIEHMGQNLQLIALNARIKAAHMGHEGAALDTISGSIYDLSKNSRSNTAMLSEMLAGVVETAKGFDKELAKMQRDQEGQVQAMTDNLTGVIDSLHGVNDHVLSIITEMSSLGETLIADINQAISGITVHDEVKKVVSRIQEAMETLVTQAIKLSPGKEIPDSASHLNYLDKHYTMKSEREIHMKHLENKNNIETFDQGTSVQDELGDNVELF